MLLLDIVNFQDELNSIHNIKTLVMKKEFIKRQVCGTQITWDSRMILYKKVQLINDRIKEIQQ